VVRVDGNELSLVRSGDAHAALVPNRFTAIGVSLLALARLNLLLNDLPLAGAGGCAK
jgi:hypothetical protein